MRAGRLMICMASLLALPLAAAAGPERPSGAPAAPPGERIALLPFSGSAALSAALRAEAFGAFRQALEKKGFTVVDVPESRLPAARFAGGAAPVPPAAADLAALAKALDVRRVLVGSVASSEELDRWPTPSGELHDRKTRSGLNLRSLDELDWRVSVRVTVRVFDAEAGEVVKKLETAARDEEEVDRLWKADRKRTIAARDAAREAAGKLAKRLKK